MSQNETGVGAYRSSEHSVHFLDKSYLVKAIATRILELSTREDFVTLCLHVADGQTDKLTGRQTCRSLTSWQYAAMQCCEKRKPSIYYIIIFVKHKNVKTFLH